MTVTMKLSVMKLFKYVLCPLMERFKYLTRS